MHHTYPKYITNISVLYTSLVYLDIYFHIIGLCFVMLLSWDTHIMLCYRMLLSWDTYIMLCLVVLLSWDTYHVMFGYVIMLRYTPCYVMLCYYTEIHTMLFKVLLLCWDTHTMLCCIFQICQTVLLLWKTTI